MGRPKRDYSKGLNKSESAFVAYIIGGMTQVEAYHATYPTSLKWPDKTVAKKAYEKAAQPHLRGEIMRGRELVDEAALACNVKSAVDVLVDLSNIAAGTATATQYDAFGNEYQAKPTMSQRLKALELLGKYHKLFAEREDKSQPEPVVIEMPEAVLALGE